MYSPEYHNNYYQERKEKIKKKAREYYHLHKNDPNYSHFLPHRLKLQRIAYAEKKNYNVKKYNCKQRTNNKLKINYGYFVIEMN